MTRAYTGKTPLYILRYRWYWWLFVILSGPFYFVTKVLVRGEAHPLFDWLLLPICYVIALTLYLGVASTIFSPLARIVCNIGKDSDFDWWMAAGGHPYFDADTIFNFDRAVVRGAIGRPPQSDFCGNCGADLRGIFNTGGNFANCCSTCGMYNDTFDAGDEVAYAFGQRIGARGCGP